MVRLFNYLPRFRPLSPLSAAIAFVACVLAILAAPPAYAENSSQGGCSPPAEIRTEPGILDGAESHVQGICCDKEGIYLVFSNYIFKIDWNGKVLRSAEAEKHSGDPCMVNGRLYVAMSAESGCGVYEYTPDLILARRWKLEGASATDGIAYLGGRFYIGGPSTVEPHASNLVVVYDSEFNLLERLQVDYGQETVYGPQAMEAWNGSLFFSFYNPEGTELHMCRTDSNLNILGTFPLNASNGIALAPAPFQGMESGAPPRFIVAATEQSEGKTIAVIRWYEFRDDGFFDITVPR